MTIDLDERKLHLPTTKNGDPLILPLSDYLLNLLRERKECAGASPWVFPGKGPAGHIVEPKKFSQRVTAASGVTFTLHDLLRTYITIAESLDIPHYALKRLLNHRSSADVTGGYIIINVDRLTDARHKQKPDVLVPEFKPRADHYEDFENE